jgi:AmmeMemoRadiSam system protein A
MRLPETNTVPGTSLLGLARGSIDYGLVHGQPLPVDCEALPPSLTETRATFTTLHAEGKLRGCCGTLEASQPLAKDVAHSAFQAAFHDPRFDPVGKDELAAISVEISVLSPMEVMTVVDEADLLDQLRPGVDGLVLIEGWRRATFLPKVWESLPEPQQFLAHLKVKCGLPGNYWSERLEFRRYRTTSYAERA